MKILQNIVTILALGAITGFAMWLSGSPWWALLFFLAFMS